MNDTALDTPVNDAAVEAPVNDAAVEAPVNDAVLEAPVNDAVLEAPVNDIKEPKTPLNELNTPVNDVDELEAPVNDMEEMVTLPDRDEQPLVHPLDLPEARSLFRRGRLIAACTSLPVAALIAAIVAYAGRNAVGPIAVFVALVVLGTLAARWCTDRAWDFIPRKRQDRDRPLPALWDIASAGVLALVLGAALLLIVFRLGRDDVPVDVRAYTFGMCAVAALLVVADAAVGLLRPSGRRRALAALPGVVVVAVATVLAYAKWFDGDAGSPELLWGALTMAGVAVLVGAGRLWDRRRTGVQLSG